jgi:hypothetical protein
LEKLVVFVLELSFFEVFVDFYVERVWNRECSQGHCGACGYPGDCVLRQPDVDPQTEDGIFAHELHLVDELRVQVVLHKEERLRNMESILLVLELLLGLVERNFNDFGRPDNVDAFRRVDCRDDDLGHVVSVALQAFYLRPVVVNVLAILALEDVVAEPAAHKHLVPLVLPHLVVLFHLDAGSEGLLHLHG